LSLIAAVFDIFKGESLLCFLRRPVLSNLRTDYSVRSTQVITSGRQVCFPFVFIWASSFLLITTLLAGCTGGPAPPKRGKLEGKVTLNGKPVAHGFIRFMALDPAGINVLATIKDGQYGVPADQGPTKGKYRCEFSVPSATKRRIPNDDIPAQFIEEAPETLPPRYHRDSTIIREYDPDKPESVDFQLTTP